MAAKGAKNDAPCGEGDRGDRKSPVRLFPPPLRWMTTRPTRWVVRNIRGSFYAPSTWILREIIDD